MVVWCTQNAPRWQQFQKAPAMSQPNSKYTTSVEIQKCTIISIKLVTHLEIKSRDECIESAQEQRIALYKSNQQQVDCCSFLVPSLWSLITIHFTCLYIRPTPEWSLRCAVRPCVWLCSLLLPLPGLTGNSSPLFISLFTFIN